MSEVAGEVGRGPRPPRVFVSYAHEYEGDPHSEVVRAFWATDRTRLCDQARARETQPAAC